MIVIGAISGGFFTPKTRQLIEIAERDIAAAGDGPVKLSASSRRSTSRSPGRHGRRVLIVLTIYVMTAKPFL